MKGLGPEIVRYPLESHGLGLSKVLPARKNNVTLNAVIPCEILVSCRACAVLENGCVPPQQSTGWG